jgi:hypothetical protein
LFERGAVAVVGASTRTYSGTGGAFTLAFFDGMLYDDQTLGGALRQAKNFLLAYALLKEKRLKDAKLGGANIRSAWAFTLWGDPTLKLPSPPRPKNALPPVRHEVRKGRIVLTLPEARYEKVTVERFEAQMFPNARLAGLLTAPEDDETARRLVPFIYAEVALPDAPPGKVPQLQGRIAERNWVFRWDARRKVGHLLITPRGRSQRELSFKVVWQEKAKAPAGENE